MKAMILAAGKGTRVRPITHTIPKPMIPILQKPVMEFLLELLKEHGFTEVMVNVSHLAEEIENYFRDGQRFGVEIAYSFEGRIQDGQLIGDALGSAGGLKKIQNFQSFFDETFVVLCGDALIDLDLTEAVRRHREKGAMASLITKRVPKDQVSSYGVVVTDADGRVRSFQEKPAVDEAASNMINTGIYIFEPEVLDFVPSGQPSTSPQTCSPSWWRPEQPSMPCRWNLNGWISVRCPTTGRRFAACCRGRCARCRSQARR